MNIAGDDGKQNVLFPYDIVKCFFLLFDDPSGRHAGNLVRDTDDKFLFVERFGYEIAGSDMESFDDVLRSVECGNENDRDMAGVGRTFHDPGDLETVHHRHHDVEQKQIGFFPVDDCECFFTAVGRYDRVTFFRQLVLQ